MSISKVTQSILEDVHECQNRPLDHIYPVLYLDCIVVKVHQGKRVKNKDVNLTVGIKTGEFFLMTTLYLKLYAWL